MGTIHRFAFNGQEFEIEEGSAVWERVTAEGHHPIDELGDAFVPAEHLSKDGLETWDHAEPTGPDYAREARELPETRPASWSLLARARELGVDAKGNWGVAKLVKAIAAAEAAQPPADDDAAPAGDGDDTASAQAD